jgi:hypothetical protein
MESTSSPNGELGIVIVPIDSTFMTPGTVKAFKFSQTGDIMKCNGLYVKSSTDYYVYISYRTTGINKFAYI